MKQIYCAGSLGDAFTLGLKIMKEKDVEIFHYTVHKHWYSKIKEIYNIFHNIRKVSFVEFTVPDCKEISGIPEQGMVWFPELNLPYIPLSCDSYVVIFPHAGREDAMARKISDNVIYKMIEYLHPIPTVLMGTDKRYKNIKCCENLIGETSIKEAVSLIIDSSGFIGPEGFPCFVSLSHRIPSVVFYVREQPVQARLINNPWQDHIISCIKIGEEI